MSARTARAAKRVQNPTDNADPDFVHGAKNIGAFLGIDVRRAFYLLEKGELPATKFGALWVEWAHHVAVILAQASGANVLPMRGAAVMLEEAYRKLIAELEEATANRNRMMSLEREDLE